MPVYEYRCTACNERTDRLLRHEQSDRPGACTECEGDLVRVWSRVGVKLSGWGFSATDGMVADRPGRGAFKDVAERAERLADG